MTLSSVKFHFGLYCRRRMFGIDIPDPDAIMEILKKKSMTALE